MSTSFSGTLQIVRDSDGDTLGSIEGRGPHFLAQRHRQSLVWRPSWRENRTTAPQLRPESRVFDRFEDAAAWVRANPHLPDATANDPALRYVPGKLVRVFWSGSGGRVLAMVERFAEGVSRRHDLRIAEVHLVDQQQRRPHQGVRHHRPYSDVANLWVPTDDGLASRAGLRRAEDGRWVLTPDRGKTRFHDRIDDALEEAVRLAYGPEPSAHERLELEAGAAARRSLFRSLETELIARHEAMCRPAKR